MGLVDYLQAALAQGVIPVAHGNGSRRAGFRDMLRAKRRASKTLNRRIASISSFYKYLAAAAAELAPADHRAEPAHSQFIVPESRPTRATRPGR